MINGAYDAETNTIYLHADATYNAAEVRGILSHTLAHEVTHSIKTWSEADYNVLTDYIRDALGADFDTLVKEKMDKLNMGYTMASDEVIADGCEMLLRDSKALEKLAMENANLFVKVASKVREFVANLRKAQTDMYGGNEELHDAALKLREALKSLEEVQEVFDNALENSIRNMRNALAEAENAKTRENLDVLEKQAEKEELHIENDGIKYSTEKTFDEQIDDVLNGKHNPRLDLYVSKTPGYLLKLNFSDCPLLMRNGKISEILNKHSDMSAEILKMIPKAIEDSVLVLKSKTNPANSVVIITDILTSKGEMIIPVWANQSGNYIDLDLGDISLNANFVASAYGRNTENLIKYAVNHNGVLYQNSDTKRVIQLLARNGLQLPTPLKLSDSIINVSEKGAAVNSKLQNFEEIIERDTEYLSGNDDLRYSEETSEEFAENEKSAIEKALANMSVKDYNRRGWARTLLTREDASKLYSAVAELFTNKKRKEFRLKDGSYAVEVNNKIIFVSGTFENPRYDSVLIFNTDNATDMEFFRDYFFDNISVNELSINDIQRRIKQRRNYGQVYGFNAESFKATGKSDFGRAKLRSDTNAFGDTARLEVRDGIHTKVEEDVSLRVQGLKFSEETDSDSSAKTAEKLKKEIANDIQRRIKQRRNYGQVYGFNAEDYKASGKSDFGRAILRSGTKGFGDISQFEVRDGVYTKDEGSVSVRVQGLKFSEETDSDSSAKTAAKLKKSKRQKGCRAAAFLLSLFDSLKPMQSGFFGFLGAFSQKSTLSGARGETPHIHSPMVGARD